MKIANYIVSKDPLAQDHAGVLFSGREQHSDESVFLKRLQIRNQRQPERRTVQLAALNMPNLICARDEVTVGSRQYAVTDGCHGELLSAVLPTLRQGDLIERHGLLKVLADVGRALEALHSRGIIHGAVNPTSILVRLNGEPQGVLLCFEPSVTRPSADYLVDLETLPFVPQEQLRNEAGFAADIYALGMLLYLSFASEKPFTGRDPIEMAQQIVWGNLEPFSPYLEGMEQTIASALQPDFDTLGALATRALQRNARARYATVGELSRSIAQMADRISPIALGRRLYLSRQLSPARAVLKIASLQPDVAAEANYLLGRISGLEIANLDSKDVPRAKYEEGVKSFKLALKQDPNLVNARIALAEFYAQNGRHSLAKREIEALLARYSNDLSVLTVYASILEKQGDGDAALNVLRSISERHPYALEAYISAMRLLLSNGQLREAQRESSRVLQKLSDALKKGNLNPIQVAEIFFLRATAFYEQGKYENALAAVKNALKYVPNHPGSHALMATLYANSGDMDLAAKHLVFSLQLDPAQKDVMRLLTRVFSRLR